MTATAMINPFPLIAGEQPSSPALLNLLIVDDDGAIRNVCREAATTLGYRTYTADSATRALQLAESANIDVVLIGLRAPEFARQQLLRQLKDEHSRIEVVMIGAGTSAETAVRAMKVGAYDYLIKPFCLEEVKTLLSGVAALFKTKVQNRRLSEAMKFDSGLRTIIGRAEGMEKLYRIIAKAAQSTHPVLILGESGTGKELVARAIHYSGPRRDKPFVPVDCGSLVPTLIESELFGHVKGAFTGAAQAKPGLLVTAEGGTVFLDEIGELALDLQARLLRALQEKEIRPIGSTKSVPINVRVLAATNRDLEQAVGQGTFRRDLYFRLNVLNLRVPPLRERREDIPLLIAEFLKRSVRSSAREYALSDDAIQMLLAYDWPGNVRELENCIEHCCAMSSGPVIHRSDLPSCVTHGQPSRPRAENRILPVADLEREAILGAIKQMNGDKLTAARLLGIGKTTLYRKLKQYRHCEDLNA